MSKEIVAPMPGTIINILVNVGDEILEYQEVLILEAMKMENSLEAPVSGKVTSIQFSNGDTVTKDAVLLIIE